MSTTRVVPHALGQCDKLSILSDLEFRCWIQCLLSADDFGVLPLSSALLRDDNVALAAYPGPVIDRALEVLVQLELLIPFEHRGTAFVVDPRWQDVQRILLPRATSYPAPPAVTLSRLSPATSRLFLTHHASRRDGLATAIQLPRRVQPRPPIAQANPSPPHSRPLDPRRRQWDKAYLRRVRRSRGHA